jgi:hypothetical protein
MTRLTNRPAQARAHSSRPNHGVRWSARCSLANLVTPVAVRRRAAVHRHLRRSQPAGPLGWRPPNPTSRSRATSAEACGAALGHGLQRCGFGDDDPSSWPRSWSSRTSRPVGSVGDEDTSSQPPWSPPAEPDHNLPPRAQHHSRPPRCDALSPTRKNLNYGIHGSTGRRSITAPVLHRRTGSDAA